MVTVEAVETSVFLRGLVGSFPELWHRACNEAMVVLVPQVASLESERISLQSAEDHLLQRTPVAGEYVTVSGKRVTITGLTTVTTGHGFPEPVTARAMEVKRLSAGVREAGFSAAPSSDAGSPPPAGCTAMLVTRPLCGGVPAPMGSSDMDAAMLRRLDAMLSAHSDAEAVFVALSEVADKARLAFERAGPMLPLDSLSPGLVPPRQRARRWTFFSSVSGIGDDFARPSGRRIASEDKVAIAVHLLVAGASDEVVAETVDVPAVVAACGGGGTGAASPLAAVATAALPAAARVHRALSQGRREVGAEAEVAVAAMQVAGGTESLLPFLSFGMALHRVADRSAAGMELDYAGATVMQAVAAICALAPWPATPGEDIDEDVL
ncbi:hypothetical protein FNF31_02550 [Cafeteria roenbergensis]|uniref:VPS9 domain-containing protein n=1 Tax=Cafeteria roenbergensis TaxID=33653 RepID=A0A5A8DJI1_CAFRO|nr:hypothetical protein FNF31_02550 [Cafeteria roenbergensis]